MGRRVGFVRGHGALEPGEVLGVDASAYAGQSERPGSHEDPDHRGGERHLQIGGELGEAPPPKRGQTWPPGIAAILNSRFVGVTAGLGTCRTLSWTGSSSTAPDTPAGVVISAMKNAQSPPTGHSHGTRRA
jgi:hypothetical protein